MKTTVLAVLFCVTCCMGAPADELTDQQQRGRRIYQEGLDSYGRAIMSVLNDDGVTVPGMACAGCHGRDGRGRSEAGYNPPDLRWAELTKSQASSDSAGRSRPPYTDRLVVRAITVGFDSGGNKLDAAMPRFQLRASDSDDLISYLHVLEDTSDDGLDANSVTIGILLPSAQRMPAINDEIRTMLGRCFDELSARGGAYGRRLKPAFSDLPESLERSASAVRTFIAEKKPFALVAFLAGAEEEIAGVANEIGVPLISAMTSFPFTSDSARDYVFYIDAGLSGDAEALASYALKVRKGNENPVAICAPHSGSAARFTKELSRILQKSRVPVLIDSPSACEEEAARQKVAHVDTVFWLSSRNPPAAFVRVAAAANWAPLLAIPGPFLAKNIKDLDPEHAAPVAVSVPAADIKADFVAAARVLVEALTRCGRSVSRDVLIQALESLYDFDAGLPSLLRFGPGRHIGSNGSRVILLDPRTGKAKPIPQAFTGRRP